MKRFLSLLLTLSMIISLTTNPSIGYATEEHTIEDDMIVYEVEGGTISFNKVTGTITGCDENVTKVTIPESIDGVNVTSIGYGAFSDCSNMSSITLPSTLVSIDAHAFYGCSGLSNITIPNGVLSIGEGAFLWCTGLTSVTLSNSLKVIETSLFSSCKSLSNIDIPSQVTQINNGAFSNCTSLKTVTIPSNIQFVREGAFSNCFNLRELNISEGVLSIEKNAFLNCGNLRAVIIPRSVSSIGEEAFFQCTELTDIVIPENVITIGENAFKGCANDELETFTIKGVVYSVAYDYAKTKGYNFECLSEHIWGEEYEIDVAPTCEDDGAKSIHCLACDEKKDVVVIEKTGHEYGEWIIDIEATLTEEGSKYKECSCGAKMIESIPATGKNIAKCDIGKIESQKCTGSIICPVIVVNDGNTLLEENVDYTISYRRNLLPGTAYVEICGIGNYQGKVTKEFVIKMPAIDDADSFSKELWECIFYKLGMTVMYGDTNDIDVTFTENDVPSAELSFWWLVRSGQIYNGMTFDEYMKLVNQDFLHANSSESKEFLIKRGWYNEDTSTLNMELYGWGGPLAWKLLNVEKKGSTYSLKGLSMFTIASDDKEEFYDYFKCPLWADFGTDNYNNCLISNSIEFTIKETKDGYKIASYQILPTYEYDGTTYFKNQTTGKFDQSFTAAIAKESYAHTGNQIIPEIIVKGRNGEIIAKDNYSIMPVTDCKSIGVHTVSVVFKGTYEGKIDLSYEITKCKHNWQEATCVEAKRCLSCGEKEGSALGHDWKAATCTSAKTCRKCGEKEGSALGHCYTDATCTKAKTCKVCGETSGSKMGHSYRSTYTVDKKATTSADGSKSKHCTRCDAKSSVTAIPKVSNVKLSTSTYTYSGGVKSPSVTIKDSKGNNLKKDTDYTLSTPSGRKNAGTYTYKVTFKGKYSGTKELKLMIKPKKIDKLTLSKTAYVYDGNAKKPTVTVKSGDLSVANKVTKSNSNATITYASGRSKVGSYKVTVKGKGNYTGNLTKTFKINPKGTKITSLTKGKKSFTVNWSKKTTQTSGYQIYYTTSKTRTNGKQITISKNTTTKKTISKLKIGKKYYVWVRTYKNVDGKKYYSTWSDRKYVTTK